MEKLMNILNPGKATDDEILYGSGRSNDPVHSGNTGILAGEGSHFDNSQKTPSGIGLGSSDVGNAPTTVGPHSTDLANKVDPRVDSDLDGSRTMGNPKVTDDSARQSSMPGSFPSHNPYTTQELDPRIGEPSRTTGPGPNTEGTGYNTTDQSDLRGPTSTATTDRHLVRDTAAVGTAGTVGEGIHHHRENEQEATGTNYNDNTGVGNTSPPNTTTEPHRSNLLNKLDPRVDSDNSRAMDNADSSHHYGRDAAVVGSAAAVGEGVHHHRENEREREREDLGSSGYTETTPSGAGSAYYGGPTGTAVSNDFGPHTTSTANRLDPAINQSAQPIEDAHQHDQVTGGGGYAADEAHSGSRHHLGRDAALGAGGVGLAEHEHRRHEREREAGVSSSAGIGSNIGADGSTSNTTTGTSGHHYGRDAAVGAGGIGLAEHEHRKHERERETGVSNTTDTSGTTGAGAGAGAGTGTGAPGPHSSSLLNRLDPRVDSATGAWKNPERTGATDTAATASSYGDNSTYNTPTRDSGHHYARDTAVGAGGIGLAEHEHRKHEREREIDTGNSTGVGPSTGTYGNTTDSTGTTGHHYGRDAAVGAGGIGLAEHEHRNHEREREMDTGNSTGVGLSTGTYGNTAGSTGTTGHHYGRDAAVGAGGIGLAEHEHRKHEREREAEAEAGLSSSAGTGPAPNTAGPHSRDWMNRLDPRVNANPDTTATSTTGYSTRGEQDAAAGAGLTGAAAYEAERNHRAGNEPGVGQGAYDETLPDFRHSTRDASAIGAATALDENEKARLRGARGETRSDYDQTAAGPGYDSTATGPIDSPHGIHHYGRDAAGAAVVGGGLYEADKHHKHDKDLTAAERDEKRERKHEEKEVRREHKEERRHGGLLSFLHRDKNKKYTREEEEEFDRQEREHNNRHPGRDAALGGAAVGGAAYEVERHNGHHRNTSGEPDTMKPLPVAPGNNGVGTGEGTQNALIMDRKRGEGYDMDPTAETTTGTGHHYGRDAAIGAGGVGLAEHEHRERERERETETGAGYDSNTTAGTAGATSTTGTAGPHSSSLMNKLDPRVDSTTGTMKTSGPTAGGYGSTTGTYSGDAQYDSTTGVPGHPLSQGSDAYMPPGTTTGDKLHGVERNRGINDGMAGTSYDNSAGTGAGSGMGYGTNDPVTNMLGADNPAERSAGYAAPKHNVLHKDPPPNHPAARAMEEGGYYPKESTNY